MKVNSILNRQSRRRQAKALFDVDPLLSDVDQHKIQSSVLTSSVFRSEAKLDYKLVVASVLIFLLVLYLSLIHI